MYAKGVKRSRQCFCRQILVYFKDIIRMFIKKIRKFILKLWWCWGLFSILCLVSMYCQRSESNRFDVGDGEIPVIVWWTNGFFNENGIKTCYNNIKCAIINDRQLNVKNVDGYLFYGSTINLDDLPLPRRQDNIIWALFHEESPRNVEEFMHEEMLNLFNFSATFSRYSNVPFPLQYLDSVHDITSTKYYFNTSVKNSHLEHIAPIMYLQSDCETSSERDDYVKELMKFIQVDSYGACLNNKAMPQKFKSDYLNNLNDPEFLKFIARYKFIIAIENGVCEDYLTEKFWRPIKVGAVPIYFGSPSIQDWLPNNKSAILIKDYPTPKAMYEYIRLLLDNDELYEEHLEHKTKSVITNKRILQELQQRPYQNDAIKTAEILECFVCRKLHEKKKEDKYIVTKDHYNCPQPISALTLQVNPHNTWLFSWKSAKLKVEELYKVINGK
ncbi:alpha-(1,3)-fucosyltransferase 10 isoform X1 [Achroia grisella]|uniref:alpha-(1,3)-fucosyltransferase 10 isoform X1 n=1 Tax=Achroia grisella TaxID=688607 RepID=UPI0027D2E120|nr:alpha-(1,3)-fucosyltransferase 10 isoform X1 [Achroia grisella]XP_059048593.1 alpha-(1,3)-fucosyltransferase 10 isoform X1 [Achroia grisella]